MKKQKGITLIALVISIIVMLILAGVSINAIVGENGVLSRAQYTSFMSEMAAVEEAVQLWKAGELIESKGQSNTAIPANGLCKVNDLTAAERLVGEIGYYRTWSIGEAMPDMNILSSAEDFNKKYEVEFIYYPAGVQDLYYLNNEALDLDKDKVYLIDATTSMIYSTTGITLNGVRCYSTSMAKAVMGNNVAPIFAEAEMSGGGDNIVYAGATYLKDKDGNYIDENGNIVSEENKVLNPHGFKIIAYQGSSNIYKLYNNGDLYGKGVKGIYLNTSTEEMEKINSKKWNYFTVPQEIPGAKENNIKIIPGFDVVYVIDKEGYLWAWGSNTQNALGLSLEQQIEYTGREATKLNVDGKKVKKVFPGYAGVTFVITESNEVYSAGNNANGALGLGYKSSEVDRFMKVEVSNVAEIKTIIPNTFATLIWYKDNTFYATGSNRGGWLFATGKNDGKYLPTFTRIYDGVIGQDFDQDIKDILFMNSSVMILKNDGTIWQCGYRGIDGAGGAGDLIDTNNMEFVQFPTKFGSNVTAIYQVGNGRILTRTNDSNELEIWGTPGYTNNLGLGEETYNSNKYHIITIPNELKNEGIKEIFSTTNNVYYLSNEGKVYASGNAITAGINANSGKTDGIIFTGLKDIVTLYSTNIVNIVNASGLGCFAPICFTSEEGQIYTVGSTEIVFRDNILQKNWIKIASNVNFFDGSGAGYVDKNNNLWIAGSDSTTLGLGEESKISKSINNYILHTDSNIQGRVAEVKFANGITMIRTTNNELWSTGLYEKNGTAYFPGWEENENKTSFVKILDDVIQFECRLRNKIAITSTGRIYGWGDNYGGLMWHATANSSVPIKFELPSEVGGIDNLKSIKIHGELRAHLITNTGELFATGTWSNGGFDGGHTPTKYFSKYTYNLDLNDNETIKQVVSFNSMTTLILTSQGRLFGYGAANRLGIGSSSTANIETQLISGIDNVNQIVAGEGFFVVVKNDGTVWGTGKNIYGILGRWIGIDRSQPNSRYKTAFEWVECPELEI